MGVSQTRLANGGHLCLQLTKRQGRVPGSRAEAGNSHAQDRQDKTLCAGSFDPITRSHLDIIGKEPKELSTLDVVHAAVGTNVKKQRTFGAPESQRLIVRSIVERWPKAIPTGDAVASGELLFDGALEAP